LLAGLLCLAALAACLPTSARPLLDSATLTPTVTVEPSATPTTTPVWFPPTPTFTPRATQNFATSTPTAALQYGELLLADDFSDGALWQLTQTDAGNIAVGNNRLNIAINQPRLLLTSLRSGAQQADFYLEVTARPSLCSGLDEYGLVVRAASAADFLRFSLSCNGQARLDRILGGTASSPFTWTLNSAVPAGAPGNARLGVWASGQEMRFYANGALLFTWNEPALNAGGIGLFARSAGETPVSVSFSNLQVYAP
jgi:hypothetical protein